MYDVKKKLIGRISFLVCITISLLLLLSIIIWQLGQNLSFFFTPTQILSMQNTSGKVIRIGGTVTVDDTVSVSNNISQHNFVISDGVNELNIIYRGPMPNMFRQHQGVVVIGSFTANGTFIANELLVKHDENYIPPEINHIQVKDGKR